MHEGCAAWGGVVCVWGGWCVCVWVGGARGGSYSYSGITVGTTPRKHHGRDDPLEAANSFRAQTAPRPTYFVVQQLHHPEQLPQRVVHLLLIVSGGKRALQPAAPRLGAHLQGRAARWDRRLAGWQRLGKPLGGGGGGGGYACTRAQQARPTAVVRRGGRCPLPSLPPRSAPTPLPLAPPQPSHHSHVGGQRALPCKAQLVEAVPHHVLFVEELLPVGRLAREKRREARVESTMQGCSQAKVTARVLFDVKLF